ncbi:MAG: helix-turn-helix domain-containing protein [Treponema sp.]|nr:helix-turn-helix domain-containing protein [Treponema sp.]
MPTTNIIQRRDLEPLWSRAGEIAGHYENAGNCVASVIGADFTCRQVSTNPRNGVFCELCRRFHPEPLPLEGMPCSTLHRNAVEEAIRLGGSYIYTCPLGFFFWASPFFSMERFAGAFVSSGAIAVGREEVARRVLDLCGGQLSRAEITSMLDRIPELDIADVRALAQMMMICTEYISRREAAGDDQGRSAFAGNSGCLSQGYLPEIAEKERMVLAHLRRGDGAEAQAVVRELMERLDDLLDASAEAENSQARLEALKVKAMELSVTLSRSGATEEKNAALAEANVGTLRRIGESGTREELVENLCSAVQRMAGKIFSFQGIRHASALRKAERFIWENYTRKVSLKEIADASGLSAPYFSTIFKEEMRENLSDYLNRLRVEKASTMLLETGMLVSEISTACGFEDQSWFSKIFRSRTGISPCKYRRTVGATEE